jgi:hypothetical protein
MRLTNMAYLLKKEYSSDTSLHTAAAHYLTSTHTAAYDGTPVPGNPADMNPNLNFKVYSAQCGSQAPRPKINCAGTQA